MTSLVHEYEDDLRDEFVHYLGQAEVQASPLRQFAGSFAVRGVNLRKPHKIPDIFLFGRKGQLGIVEAKLGRNRECGAFLIRQLLGYYVHAISSD